MTDQNMFSASDDANNNNQQNSGDPTPSSSDNLFADQLSGIKNEKGEQKYKDVASALEALQHSQQFIDTLKAEKQELEGKYTETQAELEKRESVEDVVKRLTGNQEPKQGQDDHTASREGLNEETVRNLVSDYLSQSRQKETEDGNFKKVQDALVETYGDKAVEVIRTRAKELNTSPTELEKLARSNPQMALSLLGGSAPVSAAPSTATQAPPRHTAPSNELQAPEKSLLRGASTKDLVDYWRQVQAHTHKKYDIEN